MEAVMDCQLNETLPQAKPRPVSPITGQPVPIRPPTPNKGNISNPLRQVIDLQKLAYKDATNPKLDAKERSALTRAWCDLEEARRKLKNIPLPGSLKPTGKPPKRTKPQSSEPRVLPKPVQSGDEPNG